jgi:hypothetical protein
MASEAPVAGATTLIAPNELSTYYRNARRGDLDAIESSLLINGQYKPIVANIGTHTGRPLEVLAGNHTLMAYRNLAERNPFDATWRKIKVRWVDIDEDRCTRIVIADNGTFDAGEGYDDSIVWELVQQVGPEGTGYDDADMDRLEAAMNREPEPLPKPSLPGDKGIDPIISSTITFADTEQQEVWFGFVRWLADQYPDEDLTIADRICAHLDDTEAVRA